MSELTRYCTQCDARIPTPDAQKCSSCGAECLPSWLYEPVRSVTKPATDEGGSEVPRKKWYDGIDMFFYSGVIYSFFWSLTVFLIPDGRVDFIFWIGDFLIDGITYTRIADIAWFLIMLAILLRAQQDLQHDIWKFNIGKVLPDHLASRLPRAVKANMIFWSFFIYFTYLRSLELGLLESVF